MTHLEHLESSVPGLKAMRILDLGAGRGGFLISLAKEGIAAKGVEYSAPYIVEAYERARAAGVSIDLVQGAAEALPFPDASFDFINACEVIEHVQDPEKMLEEMCRVLAPGGAAYVSVPNRFGLKDQHFHLYFVNWLPRAWSDAAIALAGKHKDYRDASAGHQRLRDMHYYTFDTIAVLARSAGFVVEDIRLHRIEKEFRSPKRLLAHLAYPLARLAYFDSFHLLLKKVPVQP